MATILSERIVEAAVLDWLEGLGDAVVFGPAIAPGEPSPERTDYSAVVLERWLRDALAQLNSDLPPDALEDAFCKLTLAALRRTLLRKLISGGLRMKDAERFVAARRYRTD